MPLISAGSQDIPAGLTADPIFCFRNSETLENFRFLVYDELEAAQMGDAHVLAENFPAELRRKSLKSAGIPTLSFLAG